MARKKVQEVQEEVQEVEAAPAPVVAKQAPPSKGKWEMDLTMPISINGKQYYGHVIVEDKNLADLLAEMHEKARQARLQEQVGKINEVFKIGGRLVIKEVK